MKVGAGGLQVQSVHDEVTNRQAQESRRTDYQQKPVTDSDNTEALNRNALNKTVEKPHDAAQPFDLPLRLRDKEKEHGRKPAGHKNSRTNPDNDSDRGENDAGEPGEARGYILDKYI